MTRILVLQGPNLDLLGTRQPDLYGTETLAEIHASLAEHAHRLSVQIDFFQSNHEGALVDRLHVRDFDGVIINAAAYTHTSLALRDAFLAIALPFVEVHLTDPWQREPFRHVNFLHDIALETIAGRGSHGYHVALVTLAARLGAARCLTDDRRRPLLTTRSSFGGFAAGSTRSTGASWSW